MYKVYWSEGNEAYGVTFKELTVALKECQNLRNGGMTFVTMVSENPDCVSKLGVDEVTDIKNYDGWISRKR